jgi:S-formylglutathione hydrolase
MGGHGALTLFLKNPGMYKSVSAFAPIANPMNCPWGEKAFSGYLGEDRETWKGHDATELVKKWKGGFDCLIDVGTEDNFYNQKQLLPENFEKAAKESGNGERLVVRYQDVSSLVQDTLIPLIRNRDMITHITWYPALLLRT